MHSAYKHIDIFPDFRIDWRSNIHDRVKNDGWQDIIYEGIKARTGLKQVTLPFSVR